MKSDINDLCEAFLAALTNAGYAVKSIENYKQVSNRFKKFCAENGYDTYTVNIGQIFADNVFNEETGAFVGYRNVMYGRFVRLINSFYLQGTFDFSMVTKEKNLPKSIHLIEIYQDYMEHLKTQYSNIGTIGFFQNGMLHLLRYMEDGGILTLKDLAVSDVVNYICSWSQKHQRNYANSNRNKEQRVYQELKEYNFWRNLYGTKGIALVVYLLIIVREITLHGTIDIKNIFLNPYPDYVVLILMTLYAVTFVLFVNKQTVIIKAFDYAKSLIEVCERI